MTAKYGLASALFQKMPAKKVGHRAASENFASKICFCVFTANPPFL